MITVTGIAFNLLLLYAIRRFSGTNLGTYKYLLTCFTSADLFLVIMHVMMHPVREFNLFNLLFLFYYF